MTRKTRIIKGLVINGTARVLLLGALLSVAAAGWAAGKSDWPMESMDPDLENLPSLQNGMKLYVNYCLGCHSLKFQRYERTADDLGIPHNLVIDNLIFTGQKIGGLMESSMDPESAKSWFGAPPPDLTMVARVRDPEWLYNYLKAFYVDESRPFGVNNRVFENVGMPHVLADLQGVQTLRCEQVLKADGQRVEECKSMALQAGSGTMNADEYDQAIYDLVNFLYYVGEPSRLQRHRVGVYVLLFLVILGVFTHLLNREYWKDVH